MFKSYLFIWRGGAEGEGVFEADPPLNVEPPAGLDPTTPRPRPELKARAGRSAAYTTQAPLGQLVDVQCL